MGGKYERDLFRHLEELQEQIEKMDKKCSERITKIEIHYEELLRKSNERLRESEERAKVAEEKVERLEKENKLLEAEIARLKSNNNNNSSNSSLPPSTDQKCSKGPNTYNSRAKSGKSSGGQVGHKGITLRAENVKQTLKEKGVPLQIEEIGDLSRPYKERLVLDLSYGVQALSKWFHADESGNICIPVEYTSEVTYGNKVKSMVILLYGQGIQSYERIVEIIGAFTNNIISLSEGTIANWLREFQNRAAPELKKIEDNLLNLHQVATDGTSVSVNGVQSYIRNFSSPEWVLYVPMDTKGHKSLATIPFLGKYIGVLLHDHETALLKYGTKHAECNVHMMRYLTKNSEDTDHSWSRKMLSLLVSMNNYRKKLIEQGCKAIPQSTLDRLGKRYDELLMFAVEEQKNIPCKYQWAVKEENALINRLKKYKANHLLFLHDFDVSFDNNLSERDLRKCKGRQKMSGGFRTKNGKSIYCAILSITETCKRWNRSLLPAFEDIFYGVPLFAYTILKTRLAGATE